MGFPTMAYFSVYPSRGPWLSLGVDQDTSTKKEVELTRESFKFLGGEGTEKAKRDQS